MADDSQNSPSPAGDQTQPAAEGDTAPTEQTPTSGGSDATGSSGGSTGGDPDEAGPGISDDQLPEDLRPSDDNPLAQPPSDEDEDEGMSLNPDGADGPQA